MISNINIIKPLLKFESEDDFYFIQILQRSKENPDLGKNNVLVKAYYIYSLEYLDKKWNEIVLLCSAFNARAYIHLNRRNAKMIAFEMMEDLAHTIKSNQVNSLDKLYNSVCGRHHSEKDKTWVVDVDNNQVGDFTEFIDFIFSLQPEGNKILDVIPTKNGVHYITKPFNSQQFGIKYPQIEIHKNNPTILFIP